MYDLRQEGQGNQTATNGTQDLDCCITHTLLYFDDFDYFRALRSWLVVDLGSSMRDTDRLLTIDVKWTPAIVPMWNADVSITTHTYCM